MNKTMELYPGRRTVFFLFSVHFQSFVFFLLFSSLDQVHQLFWCDAMEFMFGETIGKRPKLSMCLTAEIDACSKLLKTKSFDFRTECYDYLFSIAIEMRKCGFEPNENPDKVHKE